MSRGLAIVWIASFTGLSVTRITDPLVPQIAQTFAVDVNAVALLSTAFALPWAFSQPVLGPAGDLLGKTRVIVFGLTLLAASTLLGALATDIRVLFASRILSGISAAAVGPVAFALAADLLPARERQVGIGRILTASISGQLLGAVGAGLLGDFVGWRGVLFAIAAALLLASVTALFGFRGVAEPRAERIAFSVVFANYRTIFANPLAKVCFGAVFIEGIAVHGILPYVAPLLFAAGETRAAIAGLVIAGFALGGLVYAISVRQLLALTSASHRLIAGGWIAAVSLLVMGFVPSWPLLTLAVSGLGFGFFMLHNGIQVQMLELAPHARGSSVAMHAFSLFMGQAVGPVLYGLGLSVLGPLASTVIGALAMGAVGFACAHFFYVLRPRARTGPPP